MTVLIELTCWAQDAPCDCGHTWCRHCCGDTEVNELGLCQRHQQTIIGTQPARQ